MARRRIVVGLGSATQHLGLRAITAGCLTGAAKHFEAAIGAPDLPGAGGIMIRIAIEKTWPLTGIAEAARGGPSGACVGWLELVRAISDLVAADSRT